MYDQEGYRFNVGSIVLGPEGCVLWAKRIGQDSWQFPQGGLLEGETPEQALYREIQEEIGLDQEDVEILASTQNWLTYRLPDHLIRPHQQPICIGQKQKWFLLQLKCHEQKICLDRSSTPEFDSWRWVDYWLPIQEVIAFKREVYEQALKEFEPIVFPSGVNP